MMRAAVCIRRIRRMRAWAPLRIGAAALMLAVAGAGSLGVCSRAAAAVYAARIDAPRGFGHTIGDVMTERVLLAAAGHDVGDVEPPASGRIDLWLERRPARIENDRDGRRWLVLDYQIVNAPRSLTQIALPALSLRGSGGDMLQVRAWPVSVGPIVSDTAVAPAKAAAVRTQPVQIEAGGRDGESSAVRIEAGGQEDESSAVSDAVLAMQPDRGAPPIPLKPIVRRIGYALACLLVTLGSWLTWWVWRNRRDAAQLPFARGWRQLRALCSREAVSHADAAWQIVHRALNETAGQVVTRRSLSRLFARAPWLAPMQAELEAFYERSDARFFAVSAQPADGAATQTAPRADADAALVALLRGLFHAERRRHR